MLTSCRIVTRKLKLKPSCLRALRFDKYSTKVLKSHYGEVEVPDQTLSQYVFSKSENWKNRPSLTCGTTGRSYTFGMSKDFCRRGAEALLSNTGLRPGDRVGLLLPNVPEYSLAVHASLQAGLVVTFANPLYTAHELTRQFRSAKVRCIVTIPQLMETAQAVANNLENYDCTINIGGKAVPDKKIMGLESLLIPSQSIQLPEVKPDDLAVLPYSSGTTGVPKGVMLTHRNLVTNISQLMHPEIVKVNETTNDFQETVLTVLPFFHIYGFNMILNHTTLVGTHIVTMPKFTPQDYVECLIKYKPSVLFVVPSLLLFLVTHPEITAQHLSSVTQIFCGAAPMKKGLIDTFLQKINRQDCHISQGYGMTETSPGITLTPYTMPYEKSGSCGRLLPSTTARVVDLATNEEVSGPNQPGELLVKGPQVMKGYLDNQKATDEVIDSDGWLHTGDVVYYDEDEYFYIVDRTKELIKVKGNQVSPTELEYLILEIPGVADAAVVGIPDTFAGELPKAFVVRKPGFENVTPDHVQEYVNPKVAAYKKLAGGVTFVDAIPRNPSGKIMRNELKKIASSS